MDFFSGILIVVNLGLAGILLFIANEFRKRQKERAEDDRRIRELKDLRDSLDLLVRQAMSVSSRLGDELLAKKQVSMGKGSFKTDEAVEPDKSKTGSEWTHLKSKGASGRGDFESEDKYSDIVQLAKMGWNVRQISEKVNLPAGEVELVLSLRK